MEIFSIIAKSTLHWWITMKAINLFKNNNDEENRMKRTLN